LDQIGFSVVSSPVDCWTQLYSKLTSHNCIPNKAASQLQTQIPNEPTKNLYSKLWIYQNDLNVFSQFILHTANSRKVVALGVDFQTRKTAGYNKSICKLKLKQHFCS
jgi:hypothetical protein